MAVNLKSGIAVARQSMNCLGETNNPVPFYETAHERGCPRQRTKMMYNSTINRDRGDRVKCGVEFGCCIPEVEPDEDLFERAFDFDMKDKMIFSKVDICTSGPEIPEESPESMGVKLHVHAAHGTVDSSRDHMHKRVVVQTLEEKQPEPCLPETETDSSVPVDKFRTLLFILCFASMFSPGESLSFVHTNQTLPQMCWTKLYSLGTCPNPEITQSELAGWSKVCCNFANTTFHCQQIEIDNMHDEIFPACMEEQVCNAGFFCTLEVGENGFPKFVQNTCEGGSFQPVSRFTPLMVNPTCSRSHTPCDPVKQAVFCRGDATSDTRCMCADGYNLISGGSACRSATFTVDDVCECTLNNSTDKKSCTRWPNFCSQLSQEQLMNITCTVPSTPAASTTTSVDIVSWSNTIEHLPTTSTPLNTTATGTESNSRVFLIAGCIGGIVVLAILVFLICVCRKKLKSTSIYRCLKQKSVDYFSVRQGDNAESSVAQTDTLAGGDRGVPQEEEESYV